MDISVFLSAVSSTASLPASQITGFGVAEDAQGNIDFSAVLDNNHAIVSGQFQCVGQNQYSLQGITTYYPENAPTTEMPPVECTADVVTEGLMTMLGIQPGAASEGSEVTNVTASETIQQSVTESTGGGSFSAITTETLIASETVVEGHGTPIPQDKAVDDAVNKIVSNDFGKTFTLNQVTQMLETMQSWFNDTGVADSSTQTGGSGSVQLET